MRVDRTAHYYTLGRPGPHINYCWIACHGYGQLASRFIRKFDVVAARDTLILAPEGLSRFYWNGFTGDVVASWMTRADRLDEIEDYSNYLQTLYEQFIPRLAPDARVVLFGFSQGVATQVRWMMRRFPAFDHLVAWAGTVPEDLDYQPHLDYFQQRRLHFVYGTEDQFLTPERRRWHAAMLREKELPFAMRTFAGRHVVDRAALRELADVIRNEKGEIVKRERE